MRSGSGGCIKKKIFQQKGLNETTFYYYCAFFCFSGLFFAEAELCFFGFIWRVILVLVQPRMGVSD